MEKSSSMAWFSFSLERSDCIFQMKRHLSTDEVDIRYSPFLLTLKVLMKLR
jgi:hypothetical protein